MAEIDTQQETQASTNSFFNKWNILLVSFILICSIMAFFVLDTTIKNTNFSKFVPGTIYQGSWEYPGHPPIQSKITILTIDDNKAKLKYEYEWENNKSKYSFYGLPDATILPDGKSLTWNSSESIEFTFILMDDGSLKGKRVEKDKTTKKTYTHNIIMKHIGTE